MENQKASEYWTTGDVARRLKRTSDRVRQLERAGRIQAIRTKSGQRLFCPKEVNRFFSERAAQTAKQ